MHFSHIEWVHIQVLYRHSITFLGAHAEIKFIVKFLSAYKSLSYVDTYSF